MVRMGQMYLPKCMSQGASHLTQPAEGPVTGSFLYISDAFLVSCNISFSPAANSTGTWSRLCLGLPEILVLGFPLPQRLSRVPSLRVDARQSKEVSFLSMPWSVSLWREGFLQSQIQLWNHSCAPTLVHGKPFAILPLAGDKRKSLKTNSYTKYTYQGSFE